MDLNKNYIERKICIKTNKLSSPTDDEMTNPIEKAYYINIFLTKTCEIFEYVDVKKDEKTFKIDKQEINPFYINFGFFNSAKRIKVNTKSDLTPEMINYINTTYDTSVANYTDVGQWFDAVGYNILINDVVTTVNAVTGEKKQENGLERLEKLEKNLDSVTSKAFYFPILINK